MSNVDEPSIFPIIVAAGVGKRFGSDIPKQYTQINGKTVLEHSVSVINQLSNLQPLRVVISAEDEFAKTLSFAIPVGWVMGGKERMHSVFNGVQSIWENCKTKDRNNAWVLIHDAARPCVTPVDIQNLISHVLASDLGQVAGGILAVPVRDTVKQSQNLNGDRVSQTTIDRSMLWLAQTPQLFPLVSLYHYLKEAIEKNIALTDEASLFEYFGNMPLLIEGSHSNIKLTFPEDSVFAQIYLAD